MSQLTITTRHSKTGYLPGEMIEGDISWQLDEPAEAVELRLFWYTQGKGTGDVSVEETLRFDNPPTFDSRSFRLKLPIAPYSFSGKLISLLWALELVASPSGASTRLDITLSPSGAEVILPQTTPSQPEAPSWLASKVKSGSNPNINR